MRMQNKKLKRNITNISSKIVVAILVMTLSLTFVTTIGGTRSFAESDAAEPEIAADTAIVVSASTGEVIYAKHETRKMPMASTTKLMTAIVVEENMHDDSEYKNEVTITSDALVAGADGGILSEGEVISVKNLMYLMLMESSNEAANALAIYTSGSIPAFVEQMNEKAKELGALNTNFVTVNGLPDDNHYSTAEDMAVIAKDAFTHEEIKEISGTAEYTVPATNMSDKRVIKNTNELLSTGTKLDVNGEYVDSKYEGIYGGKTGTLEDCATLIEGCEQDDMDIIVVLLGDKKETRFSDAVILLNYGYANVTKKVLIKADKEVGTVRVKYGEKTKVTVYTSKKGYVYIPPEGSDSLVKTTTVIDSNVEAPLKAGTKVGEYRIYVANELQGTVDLIVKDDIAKGWFPSCVYISNNTTILIGVLLLVLLALILMKRSACIKRKKQKERERQAKVREIARKRQAIEDDRKKRNWTFH